MAEFPKIPKNSELPAPSLENPETVLGHETSIAEAADIRRPSAQRIRDEESAAQKAPKSELGSSVPAEIKARAEFLRKMGRPSTRIEARGEAFLDFLKQRPSQDEAHLLVAEAQLMASLTQAPQPNAKKKRRWREAWRKAYQKSVYLLASVGRLFRKNP